MSDAAAPLVPPPLAAPRENVGRGTLAALLTVPVGVAAWVVVWGFGFVASIVAAVVAYLALRLYVWGAGRISRVGALVVLLTTTATLLLAFGAGIVYDAAIGFGDMTGLGAWGAFTHPEFWPSFWAIAPDAFPDYLPDFGWALAFGALGSFATLRTAFAAAEAPVTLPAAAYPDTAYPDAAHPGAAAGSGPAADPAVDATGHPTDTAGTPDATPDTV